MNKNVMIGVVSVVVVSSLAAVGGTAFWMWKKNRTSSSALTRLPANSFLVARVDLDQLRSYPALADLRRRAMSPGPDASRRRAELARQMQDVVNRCHFDPLERTHAVYVGADRSMLVGTSASAWVIDTVHTATPAQATECFNAVMQMGHTAVTTSQVSGHAVLTPASGSSSGGVRDPSVHFMADGAVVAERSYMPTALRLAYHTTAGLAPSSPLAVMMNQLGDRSALSFAVDLAAVRAQNRQTIDGFADDLVRANPNSADLTLARQLVTGGVAIRLVDGGFEMVGRGAFPSATVSRPFTAATQSFWTARKAEVLSSIGEVQQSLGMMRSVAGLAGGQNAEARFQRIDAALGVARAAVDQLRITQEDQTTVVSLTLTAAQVTTLRDGSQAGLEVIEEMSSMRGGLPGLFGSPGQPERPSPPPTPGLPTLRL